MSDWQREDDRELWRAAQYSHIYGREYAQNYLAWSRAIPGILILVAICFLFPAILLIPLGLFLIWGGVAAFQAIRNFQETKAKSQAHQASIERHQAAIDRLVYDLQVALSDGNDAAVGEICKSLAREDAFGVAMPILRVALADIDPCQRLCAIRGMRWGTRFLDMRSDGHSTQVVLENMPSLLLWGLLTDSNETTRLRVVAAITLGNGGYIDMFSAITCTVGDTNPDVRAACCHALGKLMALSRGEINARSIWVNEITEQTRTEGFHAVLKALRDPHPRVGMEAAQALGEFRDPRALRSLQELAADWSQSEAIRRAAAEAVAAIKQSAVR